VLLIVLAVNAGQVRRQLAQQGGGGWSIGDESSGLAA
jgi:hypothetical protein